MVLVAITAGTLHPNPIISGMNDLPCRPILCISLSMMKAARAIYPESSMYEMKKYKIRICGRNTMTAPTPPITPSTSMSFTGPSGIVVLMNSPSHDTPSSIHPLGISPSTKVAENMMNSSRMKIGKPTYLLVRILSMRWVT